MHCGGSGSGSDLLSRVCLWCKKMAGSKLPISRRIPWLVPFLNTTFHEPCSTRGRACKSKRTFFCIDCMGSPFCWRCSEEHNFIHEDHFLLEVVRSTYKSAVRCEDIDFLDTKDIRINIINARRIYFVNCRQTKNITGLRQDGHCIVCNWPLDHKGSYCSIECQLLKNSPELKTVLKGFNYLSVDRFPDISRPLEILHQREPDRPKLNHSSTPDTPEQPKPLETLPQSQPGQPKLNHVSIRDTSRQLIKAPAKNPLLQVRKSSFAVYNSILSSLSPSVSEEKIKLVEKSRNAPDKLTCRKSRRKGVPQRSPFF